MSAYVLARGATGAARLRLLAEAAGPGSRALLEQVAPRQGWRCLDVGCGVGRMTVELARRTGHCLGLDVDPAFIAAAFLSQGASYQVADAREVSELPHQYDLIYARYLLSHLSNPAQVVAAFADRVRPGGWLVLEDIDFPGHYCHPPCEAFNRYLELYQALVTANAGNPRLGRELPRLVTQTGLSVTYTGVNLPVFTAGPPKRLAELTLSHISRGLLDHGLVSRPELTTLLRDLRRHRGRTDSLISLAPTFQVLARRQ